jgi:TolB-like protein/DNA-binding winged helix-turn-helix (wHTH) protein/Flp pilus assembly protein TadD
MFSAPIAYYDFERFRLDVENGRLLEDGKPVSLTHKAFQTLLFLVQNHGQTLKKDDFIAEIWNDSFVEEANLTQNIYILRKVLGRTKEGNPFVETVPKKGYCFTAEVTEVPAIEARPPALNGNAAAASAPLALHEPNIEASLKIKESNSQYFSPENSAIVRADFPDLNGESASNRQKNVARRASQRRNFYFAGIGIFLVGVISAWALLSQKNNPQRGAPQSVKSMAVIPFKAIGEESSNEKLGLGMADAIITRLSKLQQIPVRPTSAVYRFTDQSEVDPWKIGRELNVDAVLEGSVQREGERVRVSVRLVTVAGGKPLWAESYDEKFTDIFALQDSISSKVAQSLALNLNNPQSPQIPAQFSTANPEAYQSYVLGIYFWNKRTRDGLQKAEAQFKRAIELDPNYAVAYALLSDTYNMQAFYGVAPGAEVYPKSKEAALKALALNDALAEAHMARAETQIVLDRDRQTAIKSLERAIELSPYYSTARVRYAWQMANVGRIEVAEREMRLAQQYDPLSPLNSAALSMLLVYARKYDEAVMFGEKSVMLEPDNPSGRLNLSDAYLHAGDLEKAIATAEKEYEAGDDKIYALGALGYAYARAGRTGEASKILEKLRVEAKARPELYYDSMLISYVLGRQDEAFEYLEYALEKKVLTLRGMRYDPKLDAIKTEARFIELFRKRNLLELLEN